MHRNIRSKAQQPQFKFKLILEFSSNIFILHDSQKEQGHELMQVLNFLILGHPIHSSIC